MIIAVDVSSWPQNYGMQRTPIVGVPFLWRHHGAADARRWTDMMERGSETDGRHATTSADY